MPIPSAVAAAATGHLASVAPATPPPRPTYQEMKAKTEALKTVRESERDAEAQKRLHEAWQRDDPDLRAFESDRLRVHVERERDKQIAAQQREVARARAAEALAAERLQEELERQNALLAAEARRKAEQEKALQSDLLRQVDELKSREAEAEALRRELEEAELERAAIQKEEEERRQRQRQEQQVRYSRALRSQHKAQMLRRSEAIQQELEVDIRCENAATWTGERERWAQGGCRAVTDCSWLTHKSFLWLIPQSSGSSGGC